METYGTMKVFLRQTPKRENEHENNEADTEVPSKAAICNLHQYDRVFNEYCDQDYVFRCALKRTILYTLDGFNVTIIAYGHSGTGKTHSIFGGLDITKPEDAGMILKSVAYLLEVIEEEQLEHTVTVSYLDIYNENMYDLLSAIDDDTELNIIEDIHEKDCVEIQDLTEVTINNVFELRRILKIGAEKRVMSSSLENSLSSQRHSLFYVMVYTKEESVSGERILKRGNLIFVDAAASDYSVQSDQTNLQSSEDVNTIHQSLNTFNECIIKLANGSADIPYGESKLTRLLRDSLSGYTKTILLGTVNCSSLVVTGDFLHLSKKITRKPWIRHVFPIYNVMEKYKVKIEILNSEIKQITTSLFPNTDDTNLIIKEFEEKQAMIINKVRAVKYLNKCKNQWLAAYRIFKNTDDDITVIGENNNFEDNTDLKNVLPRCSERNLKVSEQHILNINVQVERINDLQHKLEKQHQVFCKNIGQSFKIMYNQMVQHIEKSDLIEHFVDSVISENNKECDEKFKDFATFFMITTNIIGESMKNNEAILTVLCKFLNFSHIANIANQFQEACSKVIPSTIKYVTDQKEYIDVVTSNITSCINEITSTGRQYIETKRELYTNSQNTLTESMDLQKPQQMDFEEKYNNAIDALKKMKSAFDICFKTGNERSKICESNLTARHASLTETRNMINSWHRQTVIKVNAFAENIVKDRNTQKGKLADARKLLEHMARSVRNNSKEYKNILEALDTHMAETLLRVERNSYRQEEKVRLLVAQYFNHVVTVLEKSASCTLHRNVLEEKQDKELDNCLNEYIFRTRKLCSEMKVKFTYFIKKVDLALKQCKLIKFDPDNIILSEMPPDTEENEQLEDAFFENTSVTLPEPISQKVKCNRPKYEGTLRERSKMRKTTSRRRREFEAEKARKDPANLQKE